MPDRSDVIFLVAALTLAAGVPVALYSIYYFAESIEFVATLVLFAILIVALGGLLIIRFRRSIITAIFGMPLSFARSIGAPASEAVESYIDGDRETARAQVAEFVQGIASQYVWVQTRRWIMAAATGLLLGFAGLVGSALLKQQNDLILDQNKFFQQQIEQQQSQLELQQSVANQTIRSEAIRRIYGPEFASTPRVKAEAVRSLVTVERVRIAAGRNTLPTEYINLHDAELNSAWLDSADLRKISFRGAKLDKANFNVADLTESVFRFASLNGVTFISTTMPRSHLMFSSAQDAVLSNANLRGANINQTDLRGALLNGVDLTDATLFKVNLEGANLGGLIGWEHIQSIDGTNIAGIVDAPDGFKDWALAKGAIDEAGALSDLEDAARQMRETEETAR